MKRLYKKKIVSYLILVTLLCGIYMAEDIGKLEVYGETMIVSSLPGEKPGQYEYYVHAGHDLLPRCFAIDPNDGTFYIPEVRMGNKIRLHKFDRNGKLIATLKLETFGAKACYVPDIAVAQNGDIYLHARILWAGKYIMRYDKDGKLLNSFGPQGIITQNDWDEEDLNPSPTDERYRDKYFWGSFKVFKIVNNDLLIVYNDSYTDTFYHFDGPTGQVLSKADHMPENIQKTLAEPKEKREVLSRLHFEQKWKRVCTHSIIGPDGHFYYMSVKPEKLEIRKVTFQE